MAEPGIFALHAGDTSIVLERTRDGLVCWRHWGARVDEVGLAPLARSRPKTTFSLDEEVPLTLVPTAGLGWFGQPGLSCRRGARTPTLRLTCESLASADRQVAVSMRDQANGVAVDVVIEASGQSFSFTSTVRNRGDTPLALDVLASTVLPLAPLCRDLISFTGRHNHEMVEHREAMPAQGWIRERRQGLTGHGGPPGLFVLSETADWHSGEVWALQLAWSGDHVLRVEPQADGGWTLTAGASLAPGEIVLAPGEAFTAPEAIACFSSEGRNGAIAELHRAIRARMTWPGGGRRPRPVHFNSWESVYFAHGEARMAELADAAAKLGVERFVLDDGWFAGRSSDRAGLGDWTPDPVRYPRGLAPLARHVTGLGMEFGLWIEPEMVNPDSALYRAHPDWVLGAASASPLPTARHQLVLDMSRTEVRDHLYGAIATLLEKLPVAYLKWDHNRALSPAVRADGVAGSHAQVQGAWQLWDRLRAAFPDVEIEACAAGGGRIDAGFAVRAHRFWTSDNIDALSRVEIQRGFLQFMPPELMGAHVGASPAHATGRPQSLDFSAMIALPGHFGVECDPGKLTEQERARLTGWIDIYKTLREHFHRGRCWMGEGTDGVTWQAHGDDSALLVLASRTQPGVHAREGPLRLPMLRGDKAMRVRLLHFAGLAGDRQPPFIEAARTEGVILSSSWLSAHGLSLPQMGSPGAVLFSVERL